jgi:hypothetical protein
MTKQTDKLLTAGDLADALGCFWNAAIGEAHTQQEGMPFAAIMAGGVAAVQTRLQEIAGSAPKPDPSPLADLLREACSDLTFYVNADFPTMSQAQRDSHPPYQRDIALVRRIEAALKGYPA